MAKYEITFGFTQHSMAKKTIKADSEKAACEMAEELIEELGSDSEEWKFKQVDGEMFVLEVEPINPEHEHCVS
jgi:hypothetical protein